MVFLAYGGPNSYLVLVAMFACGLAASDAMCVHARRVVGRGDI